MLIALVVAVGAGLVGRLRGGSFAALSEARFRYLPLLYLGLAIQLIFEFWDAGLSEGRELGILISSNLLVAAFLLWNSRLPGMALAGAGQVMNLIVISVNQAMPVSQSAAETAGIAGRLSEMGLKHEPMTDSTIIPWLGDVIPVPFLKNVISIGDVVLAIGIAWFVYATMTRPAPSAGGYEPKHALRGK